MQLLESKIFLGPLAILHQIEILALGLLHKKDGDLLQMDHLFAVLIGMKVEPLLQLVQMIR